MTGCVVLERLVSVMRRLRDPETGCEWDRVQTFETIAPYTIEEAYEVADAIDRRDMADLKGELGDLLFQSVFHARMAEEAGAFNIEDVLRTLIEKMVRRHPHVFGQADISSADAQSEAWEAMKARERASRSASADRAPSALDGVARALPALMRADKLTRRAARVGFDWPTADQVLGKLDEEVGELREAIASGAPGPIEEELGDILFVCANLCRKLDVDAEGALRSANAKFEKRFRAMEVLSATRGQEFPDLDLAAQEGLWQAVKQAERADG